MPDLTVGSVRPAFDDSRVGGWGNTPRLIDGQGGAVYDQTWIWPSKPRPKKRRANPLGCRLSRGTLERRHPDRADPGWGWILLAATKTKLAPTWVGHVPIRPNIPARILALRREAPGPQTEALIRQVYARFFAQDFEAALSLLNE